MLLRLFIASADGAHRNAVKQISKTIRITMNSTQKVSVELKNGRFRLRGVARIEDLNPKALLLYSTAQCAGLTIMGILGKDRISPKSMEITVEGTLDTEKLQASSIFRSFRLSYNIECRSITEQNAISRAVNNAQEYACGMVAMLCYIAPVSHEISIVSTETAQV